MPQSRIKLIEVASGKEIQAAPANAVAGTSADLGWRGFTVERHRLAPLELPEHIIEGHRLMVNAGKPVLFEWKTRGDWRRQELNTNSFSLQTHHEINEPRWSENLDILAIALDPEFVGTVFQDSVQPEKIRFRERRCESDQIIARFAAHFAEELENPTYCGRLYGESLAMAFALHLLENHGDLSSKLKTIRGKLATANLRRAIEFIHANLTEDLSIEEIARVSFLSPFHFARLFKNTVGLSPHQYVLQTRIERAKRLMTKSPRLNLTEIGLSVGFFDQAHFTNAFKRATGATPKIFLQKAA